MNLKFEPKTLILHIDILKQNYIVQLIVRTLSIFEAPDAQALEYWINFFRGRRFNFRSLFYDI